MMRRMTRWGAIGILKEVKVQDRKVDMWESLGELLDPASLHDGTCRSRCLVLALKCASRLYLLN